MGKFQTLADAARYVLLNPNKARDAYASEFASAADLSLLRKESQYVLAQLNRAHRIALDDDFARFAAEFAKQPPSIILKGLQVARLPFDTMFIEWNEHARVRQNSGKEPDDDVAERVGFLIYKDHHRWSPDCPAYLLVIFCEYHDQVISVPMGYSFNLADERWYWQDRERFDIISKAAVKNGEDLAKLADAETLIGMMGSDYSRIMRTLHGETAVEQIVDLGSRAFPIPAPPRGTMMVHGSANSRKRVEILTDIMATAAKNTTGDFRFLLSLLILLNVQTAAPVSVRPGRRGAGRLILGKLVPAYEYRVLTLERPLMQALKQTKKLVEGFGLPRRWHTVRGAWHLSRRYGDPNCDHEYVRDLDEDGNPVGSDRHVCVHCGHKKWWVPAHGRGDRKLGIIDKGYEITAPGTKKPGHQRLDLRPIPEGKLQEIA